MKPKEKAESTVLKSDKEKLREFGGKFTHIDPPEVSSDKAKLILNKFARDLRNLLIKLDASTKNF